MVSEPIQGLSYFSTEGYQRPPRPAGYPPPPQILRTDVERDTATFVSNLRQKHPIICYGIFPGWDIRHFFDEYDYHQQGGEFLYNVILQIMKENEAYCIEYCHKWSEAHSQSLHHLLNIDDPQKLFHANDRMKWGARFLEKAHECMKRAYLAAIEDENPKSTSAGKKKKSGGPSMSVGPPSTLDSRRRGSSNASRRSQSLSHGFMLPNISHPMAMPQPFQYGFHGNPQEAMVLAPELIHEHPGLHIPSPYALHQRGLEIMQTPHNMQIQGEAHNQRAPQLGPPTIANVPSGDHMFSGHARLNVHHHPRSTLEDGSTVRTQSSREPFRSYNPSARSRGRGGYASQNYATARRSSFSRPYGHQDEASSRAAWKPDANSKIHTEIVRRSTSMSSTDGLPSVPVNSSPPQELTAPERIHSRDRSIANELHNYVPHHGYLTPASSVNVDSNSPFFIASNYIGPSVIEVPLLFVGGFGDDDSQALKKSFEPRFPVDSINIRPPMPGDGKKPYAFVKLMTMGDTRAALNTPIYNLSGHKLHVQVARKCCSQPFKSRFVPSMARESEERKPNVQKDNSGEISKSNGSLITSRVPKLPDDLPTFTPQDARSSLPRDNSPARPPLEPAESQAIKKQSPPKRKPFAKGKNATKPAVSIEGEDVIRKATEDRNPLQVKNMETMAQETLKPTWANVASQPSQTPITERPSEQIKTKPRIHSEAARTHNVELIHAERLEDQQRADKSERAPKHNTERTAKTAKTQSDPKAATENGSLAPSKQTAKEERLSPINEDPDEAKNVNGMPAVSRIGHGRANTDGTAGEPLSSSTLPPGKARKVSGKGMTKPTTMPRPHVLPSSSIPTEQEINIHNDEENATADSVASSSPIGQTNLVSAAEQTAPAHSTTSPDSGRTARTPGSQIFDEEFKSQASLPTSDKAFTKMQEGIGKLISEFPPETQAHWQSRVDDIKSNIDSEEAKFRSELNRYQPDLSSTQKRSIKKRMTRTKERCQDGVDRLFMLQSEMSNELQKFRSFKEGSIGASSGNAMTVFKAEDGKTSNYQGPYFVLPGGEAGEQSAGRSVDEIIAQSKSKEASVGGSYALKGSAMAYATEALGYRPAVPLVRHNSMTSQASASSRLSYATVAASQAATSTTGAMDTPEGTLSNDSIGSIGDTTQTGPGQGRQREVSWGVGPEGPWGDKGLRGQCL